MIVGLGRSAREGKGYPLQYSWASLMAQLVKNPPAMWETWVRSLGWEDPLEKGTVTHSSILAWRILTVVLICISLMINSVELGTLFWRSFRSHLSHYCL